MPLLLVYIVISVAILVYSFAACYKGTQTWKRQPRSETQHQYPVAAFVVAIVLYICAAVAAFLAKKWNIAACPFLIPLLVTAMCAEDGLMQKFDSDNSREFVYWAVVLLLRATLITNEFGSSLLHEICCAIVLPAVTVFGRAFSLKGKQNTFHAFAPILATLIAVSACLVSKHLS